jgi:hypothetical protein
MNVSDIETTMTTAAMNAAKAMSCTAEVGCSFMLTKDPVSRGAMSNDRGTPPSFRLPVQPGFETPDPDSKPR